MKNIFIYGSCVSRDAFKLFDNKFTLLSYVARQSMISAFSPPVMASTSISLESKFQKRMVEGDLKSNLQPEITKHRNNITLLVVDLTDERLGVDKLTSTMYATHSVELVKSRWLSSLKTKPRLMEIGTISHWNAWKRSAEKFVDFLESVNLKDKTLVFYTPWAETSLEGDMVPSYRRHTASRMSTELAKCAAYLEALGLEVAYMPFELAVTTSEHEWGIAPYHYSPAAYVWIKDSIESKINSNESNPSE